MHVNFSKDCESCTLLRDLLEEERTNNRRLMDRLLSLTHPSAPINEEIGTQPPIPIRPMSWRLRKEMLEAEDRKRAQLERNKKTELEMAPAETIEDLEKELGVVDVNS